MLYPYYTLLWGGFAGTYVLRILIKNSNRIIGSMYMMTRLVLVQTLQFSHPLNSTGKLDRISSYALIHAIGTQDLVRQRLECES